MSEPGSAHFTCGALVRGALGLGLVLVLFSMGCQGGFDPPALDNPRDPNNTDLPSVPSVTASPRGCDHGVPEVRITWSVSMPQSEIAGFQIYRSSRENIDPGFLVASTGAGARQFDDGALPGTSPLLENVTYWYRVRVLSTDGLASFRSQPASAVTANCQ